MTRRPGRTLVLAGAALAGRMAVARAQCPDGTPPPCGRPAASAPVAPRRVNPPLDERTWIVVPFENVTRAPDTDWLRDASVNLLYLDLSKWRDIRVIDDERVADLIREVPEAKAAAQLTLESGLAVARRAGAGNLVMGDVLKLGARTQLVGKVFNVKSGQRVRTVRQDVAVADSIMPAFGRLARAVLNVAPPPGTAPGSIGTASVDAYQSYLVGVGYLNRWILDSARTAFTNALASDSTFALAHYKLALVYGWEAPGNPAGPRHAALAQRYGAALPARERTFVRGYLAFSSGRYGEACDAFAGLLRADSTDVEAWYNLGECSYHDSAVVPVSGDTTRMVFRGSWNVALHAFRKTLELDPTYHLAFQHIQDALLAPLRVGCRTTPEGLCADGPPAYQAVLRRSGDSLLLSPFPQASAERRNAEQLAATREQARRRNLEEARRDAEAWMELGPGESRPRVAYARILLRLGEPERADSFFRLGAALQTSRVEGATNLLDRIETLLKVGRPAEARRLTDTLLALTRGVSNARVLGGVLRAMFGSSTELHRIADSAVQGQPYVRAYFSLQPAAVMGLTPDSLFASEAAFAGAVLPAQGAARTAGTLAATLLFVDPRARGARWPVSDTASADERLALVSRLAAGDTVRFRQALVRFDSIATSLAEEPDNGFALAGALAHLAVADSAGALRLLRGFRDRTFRLSPITEALAPGFAFGGMLWPRAFLLLGDLEAGVGSREGAVAAYRLFLGMWSEADPELQPVVARARAALARLGG